MPVQGGQPQMASYTTQPQMAMQQQQQMQPLYQPVANAAPVAYSNSSYSMPVGEPYMSAAPVTTAQYPGPVSYAPQGNAVPFTTAMPQMGYDGYGAYPVNYAQGFQGY